MYKYLFEPDKCWYKDVCNSECSASCIRYMEMHFLMNTSGIPNKRQYPNSLVPEQRDYDAFCKLADIKEHIQEFVNSGNNLYITSPNTGNGKTSWAIKLLLKYFDTIWAGNGFKPRGLFIHIPTFLSKLKNFDKKDTDFEEFKSNILNVDLVVWDDIASTGMSQFDHSQLLTYIDQRTLNYQSNIYTGNLNSLSQLEKFIGNRLASRVWNASEIVEFKGGDRRNDTVADY